MEKWLKHIRKERQIREIHAVKVSISNYYGFSTLFIKEIFNIYLNFSEIVFISSLSMKNFALLNIINI